MRILFHNPAPDSIYAGRSIYFGYTHAFRDLGHEIKTLTPDSDQRKLLDQFRPNIFITSLGILHLKYLDLDLLKKAKKNGTKVFVNMPFWNSPMSVFRINETQSISKKREWVDLIRSGDFGDVYYNICEQGDVRMKGFEKTTGYKYHTILLAADRTLPLPIFTEKYVSDLSFIGTLLPEKKEFIKKQVLPLKEKYNLKLYGQDWTLADKALNWGQRLGQYLNIPYLKSFKKPQLSLKEEGQVHLSSTIALNIHEAYQKKGIGDLNERTFKIPLSGGFELIDNVPVLKRYFKIGKEIEVGQNKKDWFDKIDYYLRNPEKRVPIIVAGRKRVLAEHTYHHRVKQLIKLYHTIK